MRSSCCLDHRRYPIIKDVLHVRTGTYKDEYTDGAFGWHVERGAPAKPLGCIIVEFYLRHATGTKGRVLDVFPQILTENNTAR